MHCSTLFIQWNDGMENAPVKLCVVLPCYNEEAALEYSIKSLNEVLAALAGDRIIDAAYKLVCVDDGSVDGTWPMICNLARNYQGRLSGIKLSRNVGHQNAILAGLEHVRQENLCEAVITMDADLQDDVAAIKEMVEKYRFENCDIVLGVRRSRKSDSLLKRYTAQMFYSLMKNTHTPVVPDHAEYRLMSRRAVDCLLQYGERNVFLRGIITSMGFKTGMVYYDRRPRQFGRSKYPLARMLNFAVEGITSFSIRPIRSIFLIGVVSLVLTLSVGIYVLAAILLGRTYPGWASLMLSLWFLGSLILIALGIIGEYIGKIYLEVKQRPRYFVESTTWGEEEKR